MTYSETVSATTIERGTPKLSLSTVVLIAAFSIIVIYCTSWSLHTIDASKTIDRIVGVFPKNEERQVRTRFAQSFKWIVSQRLIPKQGGGRMAVCEILRSNSRTRAISGAAASLAALADFSSMSRLMLGTNAPAHHASNC